MAAITLAEIGRLAKVVVDRTTADPGDVVGVHLALPLPQDQLGGASVYTAHVVWRVSTVNPAADADGTTVGAPAGAIFGTDYIAPVGLTGLSTAVSLFPPFGAGAVPPAPTAYWVIARVTLNWAADVSAVGAVAPAGAILQTVIEKASPQINANGMSATDLADRVLALLKIELPGAPVAPGSTITARLRPKGAEDAPWDVESATEIAPHFDLAAKVPLEPLFKPLGRIINGVFGVGNQITGAVAKLFTPLVKAIGALGKAIAAVVGALGFSNPRIGSLSVPSVLRTIDKLVRRLRIRDVDIFRGLDLPIDANLVNRNFTKNLVPHDAVPPLPGPRSILPSLPTLENQLEVTDALPDPVSMIPVAGNLAIPIVLNNVVWELWSTPNLAPGTQLPANQFRELDHTAGRKLKKTYAIEPPLADGTVHLRVQVDYTVNEVASSPGVAALGAGPRIPGQIVSLPIIPIRLIGFDPLAFVAQQLQLTASTDELEAGDPVLLSLQSAIPSLSSSPSLMQTSFPLGALPLRTIPITVTWEALDENLAPLAEGTGYALSGTEADARSLLFAPVVQILRRENPAAVMRYVQVRLASGALPAQVIGPIGIPVVPILIPLFVAFFKYAFFAEQTDDETVQVLVPSFYVSHAPSWVESWETFRERLDELQKRVGRLVGAATRTSNAAPPAAGSLQDFSGSIVQRLTLLRGALDYVVNRPATGKLEFMRGHHWAYTGAYIADLSLPGRGGVSLRPFFDPGTIIVVNDALTTFLVHSRLDADDPIELRDLEVHGTPANPVCILWPTHLADNYWWINWVPNPLLSSWIESVDVTCTIVHDFWNYFDIHNVRCEFDQAPGVNDYMPWPATVWKAAAS